MTRITRPSLADLWRVALARLEGQGAADAPAKARALAVSALIGRTDEVAGVRVERHGDAVLVSTPSLARAAGPANLRCRKMACASS